MKNFLKKFWKKTKESNFSSKKDYKMRESVYGNFFYHISLDDKVLCGKKNTMTTHS